MFVFVLLLDDDFSRSSLYLTKRAKRKTASLFFAQSACAPACSVTRVKVRGDFGQKHFGTENKPEAGMTRFPGCSSPPHVTGFSVPKSFCRTGTSTDQFIVAWLPLLRNNLPLHSLRSGDRPRQSDDRHNWNTLTGLDQAVGRLEKSDGGTHHNGLYAYTAVAPIGSACTGVGTARRVIWTARLRSCTNRRKDVPPRPIDGQLRP